jgi:hypothetical protein
VKTAVLLSIKEPDFAAAGRLVERSNAEIITSADEIQRLILITPLLCETGSQDSLLVPQLD